MRRYDFISGLFLLGVSGGACIVAYRLGFDDIRNPGPGLIPFGVAVLLGLMSAGLLIRSFLEGESRMKDVFKGIAWERVIVTLVGLIGYGIFFNSLGFSTSNFLLMMLLLGAVSRMKWRWALLTSFMTVLCAYLIFVAWLGVPFPAGSFGI